MPEMKFTITEQQEARVMDHIHDQQDFKIVTPKVEDFLSGKIIELESINFIFKKENTDAAQTRP